MRNTSKMTTLENKFPLLAVEHGCIISKDGAPVTVMVIPTNEELMIAQDTLSIVEENKNK